MRERRTRCNHAKAHLEWLDVVGQHTQDADIHTEQQTPWQPPTPKDWPQPILATAVSKTNMVIGGRGCVRGVMESCTGEPQPSYIVTVVIVWH